jgi:hypothetical protein
MTPKSKPWLNIVSVASKLIIDCEAMLVFKLTNPNIIGSFIITTSGAYISYFNKQQLEFGYKVIPGVSGLVDARHINYSS